MAINESARLSLQQTALEALHRNNGLKFDPIWLPYTSGEVGPYYIQSLAVADDGDDYATAIESLSDIVEHKLEEWGISPDAISGGESRDWDFSNPVAYDLALPHVKLYERRPAVGTIDGRRFAHVADLNNEGSSMREKWVPQIRDGGGSIAAAFFYVDRRENGVAVLDELGIPNDAVVRMDANAWQFLLDEQIIDPVIYRSLMERNEDRHVWARRMLRAHPEPLVTLLQSKNPKDIEKGTKILTTGYPDMRDELVALMKEKGFEYLGQ
jgi:orotate phosphoribosyltransferase